MNNEQVIDTKAVVKTYAEGEIAVHALQAVSLTIKKGEFTALVGPSGSGKTTLLNIIGGLDTPTSGCVCLDGHDISTMGSGQLADFRRDHIGFIFQAYNLIPSLTVQENAEYVLLLQGASPTIRQKRVSAMLAKLGLHGMERRFPKTLSGGQQQRVAIARAMVSEPKIILADEPTANVDSKTAAELLDLMHNLNQNEGMTFLFSTHDPAVMERADRVVHLHDGKIERVQHNHDH